jgi:hypothetical protein
MSASVDPAGWLGGRDRVKVFLKDAISPKKNGVTALTSW